MKTGEFQAERWNLERQHEETAKRELFEETNLQVGEMKFFGIFSGKELYYRYPSGDEVYNVSIVYITHNITVN